ncbi:hypothetical protein ACFQX7_01305 [Luedemannella flava]
MDDDPVPRVTVGGGREAPHGRSGARRPAEIQDWHVAVPEGAREQVRHGLGTTEVGAAVATTRAGAGGQQNPVAAGGRHSPSGHKITRLAATAAELDRTPVRPHPQRGSLLPHSDVT